MSRVNSAAVSASSEAQTPAWATWRWALAISAAFAAVRLLVVFLSPLELYPDEAQYWVWSHELAFGYFSKPPLIAWIIRLTTAPFGAAEPFVRLSSPLLHGAAGLFAYAAARRLYDTRTGLVALLIYTLMPAVQLGAFVVSTDTPLIAFLSAALWLYVVVQQTEGRRRIVAAAAFGAALGLAFLSKYAALYALIGVGLHLSLAREARRPWKPTAVMTAMLAFLVTASPNLIWNATHDFATIHNTAANANWARGNLFHLDQLASFIGSQFGVFGPAPFAILLIGGGVLAARRRLVGADALLLCWTVPALAIVTVEAFVSRAHPNWAVAAYLPGSILVAAWLVRWRTKHARRTIVTTVVVQGIVAAVMTIVLIEPGLTDAIGLGDAFSGMRGWRQTTDQLVARARTEALAAPLTAVAVDSRYLFNEAAYYGRDFFGPGDPPLRAWRDVGPVGDQAHLADPLTSAQSGRVLAASLDGGSTQAMIEDFVATGGLRTVKVRLSARQSRRVDIFIAYGMIRR